jgi:hypothetical protein
MTWRSRACTCLLGAIALVAGVLASAPACLPRGCPEPFLFGVFEVDRTAATPGASERPELEGAIIDANEDSVVITFDLPDGSSWRVEYDVVGEGNM